MDNKYRIVGLIIGFAILGALTTKVEIFFLKSFFRTLAVGAIGAYGILRMPEKKMAIHIFFIIGIGFSILADFLYYWPVIGVLMAGFGVLNAYLFYSIGFFTKLLDKPLYALSIFPISIGAYLFTRVLFYGLDKHQIGYYVYFILIYIAFISIFTWASVMTGNRWIILGMGLFIAMDIVRSLNKFVFDIPLTNAIVLLLYVSAHFFIAHSMAEFKDPKIENNPEPNVQ